MFCKRFFNDAKVIPGLDADDDSMAHAANITRMARLLRQLTCKSVLSRFRSATLITKAILYLLEAN